MYHDVLLTKLLLQSPLTKCGNLMISDWFGFLPFSSVIVFQKYDSTGNLAVQYKWRLHSCATTAIFDTLLKIHFSINKWWAGKWRISHIRYSLVFVWGFVCFKNTHVVYWILIADFILVLSHCSWGWLLKRVAWNRITIPGPAAS